MPGIIRPYKASDRLPVRKIYGMDEFARPRLLAKYPSYGEYLADEMSYYPDLEFASSFHPLGVAVYQKLGLTLLGQFEWKLHNGFEWVKVIENIFGRRL
jgi:hypothetical protein